MVYFLGSGFGGNGAGLELQSTGATVPVECAVFAPVRAELLGVLRQHRCVVEGTGCFRTRSGGELHDGSFQVDAHLGALGALGAEAVLFGDVFERIGEAVQ
jgi:hypothetical protein